MGYITIAHRAARLAAQRAAEQRRLELVAQVERVKSMTRGSHKRVSDAAMREALCVAGGNVRRAAKALGVSTVTVSKRAKKLCITTSGRIGRPVARAYSLADDEAIAAWCRGERSLTSVCRDRGMARDTAIRRSEQLGLVIKVARRADVSAGTVDPDSALPPGSSDEDNLDDFGVAKFIQLNDPLLAALRREHPGRDRVSAR